MNKKRKTKSSVKTKLPLNQIIHGHNIRVMRKFSDNSIDSIITDPPYGIGFMGKDWDNFKPEFIDAAMAKDKRPHTGIASQRRSNTAGTYDYSRNTEFQKWFTKWAKECLRIAKPGAFMFVFGGTRTYHRLTCAIEDAGWQIRDCLMWLYGSGFPKSLDISKAIDKTKGKKRKIIKKTGQRCGVFAHSGSGTPQNINDYEAVITAPISELAKLWDGYGTGLKPAWEPIIVAMKPVDGNFAKNAEKYGVAGLNIDGGRIKAGINHIKNATRKGEKRRGFMVSEVDAEAHPQGRWPANVMFDEEAARLLDKQSGSVGGGKLREVKRQRNKGWFNSSSGEGVYAKDNFGDSGGASRFFYIAKASRSERNAGLSGMEAKKADIRTDIAAGMWKDKNAKQQNFHPTVKPLQLMWYLCMLLKMPNKDQIILDPFAGSGTTCVACKKLGINYIGIDNNEDYCEIARKRLKNVKPSLFEKSKRKKVKKKKSFGLLCE